MRALHLRRAGRLLAVTLLVVVAVATPTAASANATFAEKVAVEQNGDIASIPVTLSGTDRATLGIESDGSFGATLSITDADGDGRVTVQFNTFLAGRDATQAFETTGPDEVSVVSTTPADVTNATGDYELSIRADSNADDPDDVAALVVTERQAHSLDAWAAPRNFADDLTSPTAIEQHRRNGSISNDSLLLDNLLVIRLQASGLEGVLAAQEGTNATDRFVGMVESEQPNLTIVQTNPTPELPPKVLLLNDTRAVDFVPDASNDTYYLVVDVARVRVDPGAYGSRQPSEHWLQLDEGEEFQALFTYNGTPSPWNADERPDVVASRRFELAQRQAKIEIPSEYGPWFVRPEPGQVIEGYTNLNPDERMTLLVHAPNGTFHREKKVVASDDGDFRTSMNLSGVPDGTTLQVDVRYDDRSLLFEPAHAVVDRPDAAVEIVGYDVNGSYYGVDVNATVSRGGFVVLHRGSVDGPVLDVSQYLSPGTHSWKTVSLSDPPEGNATIVAVVHRDANGDRSFDGESDSPYEVNGTRLTDSRTIDFPEWETATPTPSPTLHVDPPRTPRTDGQPGFGSLVAISALLALVALARRRS